MKLTQARKSIISRYVFALIARWAAAFGILNLSAIILAIGYIWYFLPDKAYNAANDVLKREISVEKTHVAETLNGFSLQATRASVEAEATLKATKKLSDGQQTALKEEAELELSIAKLKEVLEGLKNADPAKLALTISELKNNPDVQETILKLESLQRALIPIGTIVAWNGTGVLPKGWLVCNGKNNTPYLENLFLKGVLTQNDANKIQDLKAIPTSVHLADGPWFQATFDNALGGKQVNIPPNYSVIYIIRVE